ncbi:MAG: hypothetical protein AB8E15_12390 [Bdellovibrionales bacterium]
MKVLISAMMIFGMATTLNAEIRKIGKVGNSDREIVRIAPTPSRALDRMETKEMRRRIRQLERAVIQLQDQVYNQRTARVAPRQNWTCKVTTKAFNNTYFGDTSATRGAAERSAFKQCRSKESFASSCSVNATRMNCTRG